MNKKIQTKYYDFVSQREDRKLLYKSLISLVVPIAIQNLLGCLVTSADVIMLGYVGQDELAAVSLANQYVFILWGFFFGVNSAATIMNSQYWGKGDLRTIQAVMGIAFKLCFALTFFISCACIFFPRGLMTLYTDDQNMISIGSEYLRVIGISYTLMSFSQAYQCTLRTVEKAKKSTVISTVTVFINVFLNAVFIFGLFNAPKLGVFGVALATSVARVVELVICIADYISGRLFKPDIKLFLGKHKELRNDFIKYAGPALVNDLMWTLAFSSYSIILGHLNADIVAASSVATTLRDLFTTVCFGIAAGGSVLIGKSLGCNDLIRAKKDSRVLLALTVIVTVVMGIILAIVRHPLMNIFTLTERAYGYLDIMMLISCYYIIGQTFNTLMIAGIFRAGGNTKFGMICDIVTMWFISVPISFFSAFVLKLPPMWIYFIICLDEFYKIPVVIKYYRSDKWLNNITRENLL